MRLFVSINVVCFWLDPFVDYSEVGMVSEDIYAVNICFLFL